MTRGLPVSVLHAPQRKRFEVGALLLEHGLHLRPIGAVDCASYRSRYSFGPRICAKSLFYSHVIVRQSGPLQDSFGLSDRALFNRLNVRP